MWVCAMNFNHPVSDQCSIFMQLIYTSCIKNTTHPPLQLDQGKDPRKFCLRANTPVFKRNANFLNSFFSPVATKLQKGDIHRRNGPWKSTPCQWPWPWVTMNKLIWEGCISFEEECNPVIKQDFHFLETCLQAWAAGHAHTQTLFHV